MFNDISIIQTLYFNTQDRDPMNNSVRFLSPEFHWMSWALSCLQLKKLYGKVSLFTNESGAEVLIDRLKLPYDRVDLRLNNIKIDSGLGVLPKVYTYSFQDRPFLHFDGDVIMWERLNDQLLNSPVITQNLENADYVYRSFYKKLIENGTWLPDLIMQELLSETPIKVFNLGIVGGNNISFFKDFARKAFEMIENNNAILHLNRYTNFNLVYEQHLFYCLTKHFNINVNCYKRDEVIDLHFDGYADFLNVPHQNKFVHLLGDYKQEEHTCLRLARRLRNDYPETYYQIISECKKAKVKLYLGYYNKSDYNQNVVNIQSSEDDSKFWTNLYREEIKSFSIMDLKFSNMDLLAETQFVLNKKIDIGDSIKNGVFEDQFLIESSIGILMDCCELILDTLDQLLINVLQVKISFLELLKRIEVFFDNDDEIQNDYSLFITLISRRLKMGIEQNLYVIVV